MTMSFNWRVFSSISGEPFRNYSTILGDQKYYDKFTYMRSVFGLIFLARNDYIKPVTVQTCWMHLPFVLVVSNYFVPNRNEW